MIEISGSLVRVISLELEHRAQPAFFPIASARDQKVSPAALQAKEISNLSPNSVKAIVKLVTVVE
jgi:hypothetical protein